jgi:hypothetical protein
MFDFLLSKYSIKFDFLVTKFLVGSRSMEALSFHWQQEFLPVRIANPELNNER